METTGKKSKVKEWLTMDMCDFPHANGNCKGKALSHKRMRDGKLVEMVVHCQNPHHKHAAVETTLEPFEAFDFTAL